MTPKRIEMVINDTKRIEMVTNDTKRVIKTFPRFHLHNQQSFRLMRPIDFIHKDGP